MLYKLFEKLFLAAYYFTIAIKRSGENIIQALRFKAEYVIPANSGDWCADPFIAEDNGKAYLFYEKVENDLGRIEVAEIYDDCSVSKPTVILSGDSHYSYPYVFKKSDKWYMIPESSAQGEVCLYEATQFPYKWANVKTLLHEAAVDTTVFEYEGNTYLLTFIPEKGTEYVQPKAYVFENGELAPLEWTGADRLSVRGAGAPFEYDGKLYRPVQVSTPVRYGDKVAFAEISINGKEYSERICSALEAESISAKLRFYDGLHTYSASEHFEVIDIRCREFDIFKPVKKLCGIISKLIKHAHGDRR